MKHLDIRLTGWKTEDQGTLGSPRGLKLSQSEKPGKEQGGTPLS